METPARPVLEPARIGAIDALRGLVMLLMLVDHVRGFFSLHGSLGDPIDLARVPPGVAWTRIGTHLCAPIFILLTGLSAHLHARKHGAAATGRFLVKRGLLLILLELTLVSLAWSGRLPPTLISLQVIWAIGIAMIALVVLARLPHPALIALALGLMFGHNALDGFVLGPDDPGSALWSVLHQRATIALPGVSVRTSYPVLPWIGVIAAGYALGPLYAPDRDPAARRRALTGLGLAALVLVLVLRGLNGYGDPTPWQPGETAPMTVLAFLNLTKYPPSADYLLATLGIGLLLLALLERASGRVIRAVCVFGGAPLFFYLLHLWLLRLAKSALAPADGTGPMIEGAVGLWLVAAAFALVLYPACLGMVRLKRGGRWPALSYL